MAPFAVLAPLVGPLLDRVQDGRRYILAGTLLARGLLCWGMAGAVFYHDSVTLLPAAFGVLVLQKAYGVSRSAVTARSTVLTSQVTCDGVGCASQSSVLPVGNEIPVL